MKLGVLTYHKANNYGAYLQAYALIMKFIELGFEAEIIDYNMKCAEIQYKVKNRNPINRYYENIRYKMFCKQQEKLPKSKDSLISDNIEDFLGFVNNKYDIIVAGSDEIWKLDSFRGFPTPYWLIGNGKFKKLSYAASSRSDFSKLKGNDIELIRKTLKEFSLIGVRDSYTYNELDKVIETENKKLVMCCDPVFLYPFNIDIGKGKEILFNRFGVKKDKPILGVMSNDKKMVQSIKKELGKEFELVSLFRQWKGYKKTPELTPFEWIDVIAALDVLVSNYFHGICFSLLSNTYFVAVDSRDKNVEHGKIYDLLNRNK